MSTKPNTYLLHEGKTENGERFGVFATLQSKNIKTGNMIQLAVILLDHHPVVAVQSGLDAETICRGCPFASGNGCYVEVGKSVAAIWNAWKRGNVPMLPKDKWEETFSNRMVRFGSYGNPSLIPLAIVRKIARLSNGWTGYFHDWHLMTSKRARAYGEFFMASTDTKESYARAQEIGLHTFHVGKCKDGDVLCPSESHGINCIDCQLCKGTSVNARSIFIAPHGGKKGKIKSE